jgi:uroporphyrinogen-III decarboxylase
MGMMARVHSGVETLAYLWADAPDALRDLFEVMERNHLDAFRLAATSEADALVGMDDTSTTVISPRMFGEVCLAYTDHIAEAAHEAGKFYFHHSCGLIRNLLPLYRQTKMEAVHAFQIPPIGDVTIAEGKRLLGPRITIIASLVQMCGSLADRAAVERSIRQMFEDACPGDNVILGVAADPEKTMEETAFVVASCMKYRDLALTANATR